MTDRLTIRDDRAVSSTVAHVTALGVMAILVSGLLIAANGVFQHEQEKAAREQLLTIGNRLADELARASRLARAGGSVSITTRHQNQVAGESYIVRMLSGSDCDTDTFTSDSCLQLELSSGDTSVKVPVENETEVTLTAAGDGQFSITASPTVWGRAQEDPATNVESHVGIGEGITASSGNVTSLTNREPIAGFTFSPGHPTVDSVIHFENDTEDLDGIIMSYEWDLGDGSTRTGGEFNYSYLTTGKYTVTLNVTDDDGDTDNVSKVVEVSGLVYNEDVTAGDVGGGITHGRMEFTVTNKHAHKIRVKEILVEPHDDSIDWLSAKDSGGSDQDDEIYIAGTPQSGGHDGAIELYDNGRIFAIDADGTVNNGNIEMSAGTTATVELVGFGQNENSDTKTNMTNEKVDVAIRYEVVGGLGSGQAYTSKFTLNGPSSSNEPPDPDFTYSCTDLDCSFDGTGSSDPDGGSITSYEWDFDDGNTTTGSTPSHTFPSNDTYDVSLTVTDDEGTSSTITKSLTFSSCSGSTGLEWYDDAWHNRKEITVDHTEVEADLSNFPMLVDISGDSDLEDDAQNDGDDIVFAQGCTKLDHEIEEFDGSDGDLVAWVNVTSLSSTSDTTFHMYYNNSGASNQENAAGVWGPDYEMVQHFEESSGTPDDSTSNANDGTNSGAIQGADGQMDGGYDFTAPGGHVEVPDSINDGEFTIEMWYETPSSWWWQATLFDATLGDKYFQIYAEDDDLDLCFEDDNDDDYDLDADLSLGANTWHHAVVTAEYGGSGPHELYVDGNLHDSSSDSLSGKPSLASPYVGYYTDSYDGGCERKRDFDGSIDEVRILSRQLSSDWIETEYNNQADPSDFYTVSDEQRVFVQNEDDTDRVVMEAESYMHTVPGNDDDDGPGTGDDMSPHTWVSYTDGLASDNTALDSNNDWGSNAGDTRNGERLDYYVDFSQTGTHYVWVRMECDDSGDDSVHLGINGTVATFGAYGLNASSSTACHNTTGWMWASHKDHPRTQVTIDVQSTGGHVINLWMREDGTKIDKIVISSDPADAPSGTGPDESEKR